MKHLFIGGYYDGHRMQISPGVEQIIFETRGMPSVRFIYTRRVIIDNAKKVFVFVLDGMHNETIFARYLALTKGKKHGNHSII